jgi:hypothetical protein
MALGGSGMDVGWGGASAGLGDGESNTRGCGGGGGGGETDIESRISILAMQVGRAHINCQQKYSGS